MAAVLRTKAMTRKAIMRAKLLGIEAANAGRHEISALLMSGRAAKVLATVKAEDVVAGDLTVRTRVAELEMWGVLYRAAADESALGDERMIKAAKVILHALERQADLAGIGKAQEAPGAETGPGGEQIQALLRHVLRTDPRFEKAYLAAAAGKPWQEVLEGETIEIPATKVS